MMHKSGIARSLLALLDTAQPSEYFGPPLPSQTDLAIFAAVEATQSLTTTDLDGLAAHLCVPHRYELLRGFAERMATASVRMSRHDLAEQGVRALTLDGFATDARESMLILPLLCRSLELLHFDPVSVLRRLRHQVPSAAAVALLGFADLPPFERGIGRMGYVEVGDGDQFIYERQW